MKMAILTLKLEWKKDHNMDFQERRQYFSNIGPRTFVT
jgi:hypothetical protein